MSLDNVNVFVKDQRQKQAKTWTPISVRKKHNNTEKYDLG
jgi:hypothetical protein